MIVVRVGEHDVGDRREIDPQLGGVFQHGLGSRAGVDEQPASIDFDERSEAPLADACLGARLDAEA